jgi:glycosyltransferase involved in cell wall biosynthesis
MIVKNEGSTIERVLNCARVFADEMIVVDTGSTDDTVAKAMAMGARVYHFDWIDDFSAARNFSFAKCTGDWIIWLDGDDIILPESQALIQQLKSTTLGNELEAIYLRYIYPPFLQWRERMVRRDLFGTKLEWREPIHECIHGIDAQKSRYVDSIAIQHEPPPERTALKKDRNITILRKHYQDGAADERMLYIYAVECLHSLYKEEAEHILAEFFSRVDYQHYRYEIYCKMYDFYTHFNETQKALDAVHGAIKEDPKRAEAYYRLGKHLSDKDDQPAAAIPLLTAASMIRTPDYGTPEAEAYTYGPWESLCRANFRLQKYDDAREMAKRALQHDSPREKWLAELVAYDLVGFPAEPLPHQWQEWTDGNLGNHVPHSTVIRVLEENNFSPGQIITGMRLFDGKMASRSQNSS